MIDKADAAFWSEFNSILPRISRMEAGGVARPTVARYCVCLRGEFLIGERADLASTLQEESVYSLCVDRH